MSLDCGLFMGKTTKAVVSCIIISIAILFSTPDLAKTILPTAVALQSHSVISINGNSGFTAANGVTSGTGTAADPYVISGWDITCLRQEPQQNILIVYRYRTQQPTL